MVFCGCFAIATYAFTIKMDDFSSYKEIYIGKSMNMWARRFMAT